MDAKGLQLPHDIAEAVLTPLVDPLLWWIIFGISLIALIAALYAVWAYRIRKSKRVSGVVEPPALTPQQQLDAAMFELERAQNDHLALLDAVSKALRCALSVRGEVSYIQMTTDEIAASLESLSLNVDDEVALIRVLRTADHARFAAGSLDSRRELYEQCKHLCSLLAKEKVVAS